MKQMIEIPHTAVTKIVNGSRHGGRVKFAFAVVVLSLIVAMQIGCSRDTSEQNPDLQSIQLVPVNDAIPAGTSTQFVAMGTFNEGASRDISGSVTWSSSNTKVAVVNGSGLVNSVGKGVTTISAKKGEHEVRTRLRVGEDEARAAFVYVANHDVNTISIFSVDPITGQLTDAGSVAAPGSGPRYLEFDPTGDFLFVTFDLSNMIASFAVDSTSGALTLVPGTPVHTGAGPKNIAIDPAGKFLYLSNAGSNDVSGYTISNGSLKEVPGSPFMTGLVPYGLEVSESGLFLYVTNRDSNTVTAYAIDQITGSLAPIAGSPFAAGMGPRAIALSETGEFAFVPNRFSNDVTVYRVDTMNGALTPVAGSPFPAGMDPRSVTLDASGQFLYVGNTASNDVSAYVIDTDTGALMPTPGSPFPAGIIPLDLTADPSGRFLYVVNNGSNDVTVYSINNDTGSLSLIQTIASGGNAISIAIKESAHEVE